MYRLALVLLFFALPAHAQDDNWGCTCLLCLADPRGPTTEAACRPPIYALWRHLAKGKRFPLCIGATGVATTLRSAGSGWCTPQLTSELVTDNGKEILCNAWASIDVEVPNQNTTRIWFGIGGGVEQSLTEIIGGPRPAQPVN